jgi:hypothetical protein
MKVGIAVFAYNRCDKLHKVLDGLKKNDGVTKLYIFHDGLKCEADRQGWLDTRREIDGINWSETILYASDYNKGLAKSIVDGIDTVLKENDAVIILEDDCVPQPAFIAFMKQCFEQYQGFKNVYSVSGYSWPIGLEQSEYDAYFCGRPCPWGWGTWKDRWALYQKDYNMIIDIKQDRELSRNLAIWGDDLEDMLIGNIRGTSNSWYVLWALLLIHNNGIAVNPYKSLVQNEGFDGTGVHCGSTGRFDVEYLDDRSPNEKFILPSKIAIEERTQKAFRGLYGGYSVKYDKDEKKDILLYGVGNYYKKHANQICEQYNIVSFVDKNKKDKFYAGIEIIHPKQIDEKNYKYIVVMIENKTSREKVKQELQALYGVENTKILIGQELYGGE